MAHGTLEIITNICHGNVVDPSGTVSAKLGSSLPKVDQAMISSGLDFPAAVQTALIACLAR